MLAENYKLGYKVTTDYYENEVFEVVGIRKDQLELRGDWSGMNNTIGDSWYPIEKCKPVLPNIEWDRITKEAREIK
jgi:hypothetical protein